jgi:hypothetical protein
MAEPKGGRNQGGNKMSELQEIFSGYPQGLGEWVEIGDDNTVKFKLQEGPIGEAGANGCQVDDMIFVTKEIVAYFNERFPCNENKQAIAKLGRAMELLALRKADRERRGVEGTNQE